MNMSKRMEKLLIRAQSQNDKFYQSTYTKFDKKLVDTQLVMPERWVFIVYSSLKL